MDQPTPLPKRIVWFAPWTWRLSQREKGGLIAVAIVGYLLSPGVIQYGADRFHLSRNPTTAAWVESALYPPRAVAKVCPYLATVHREEWAWMSLIFGAPTYPSLRQIDQPPRYTFLTHLAENHRLGPGDVTSFRQLRNGKVTAITADGRLIVNDRRYGRVADGDSIVVEVDGRVLVNGRERESHDAVIVEENPSREDE